MNFLVFVSLFTVAVFGIPLKEQLLSDPMSFLTKNSEGGVDAILDLIASLRSDNAKVLDHLTTVRDDAQATHDDAQVALAAATAAENQALGNVDEGEKDLAAFKVVAAGATAVEADAEAKKQDAQEASDKAASFLASESERLDQERSTLEEVIALIESLEAMALSQLSSNRKLLSIVDLSSLANADPGSVAKVKSLINDLVDAGEAERDAATKADATATDNLATATEVHQDKWNKLAVALGNVDFQAETNEDLEKVATAAVQAKKDATHVFNSAVEALGNAADHLQTESDRIDSEEAIFVEVSNLLATLA